MKPMDFNKAFVPAGYGLLILEVAGKYAVDAQRLLADAGVAQTLLQDPNARMTAWQAGGLLYLAMQRSQEPAFGYEIGLHSQLTSHGIMGYGLLSSATLKEAIEMGEKFVQLRLPMIALRLFSQAGQAVIDVRETAPLGPMRQCVFDLFLVGLARMAPTLIGQKLNWNEIELFFDYPQPSYYPKYQTRLPPTRFNTGVIQLRFDEKYLDFKPETANPVTARMVEEQCLREMEQLGLAGDLVKQVRSILETGGERYPALGFVAEHLHMSERSLKRKLREQGASYRQLLDAVRYQDSIRLLQESQLNIEQVAVQLGYTDPANFTRAFRKWSGVTPSEYRHMRR